MPPKTIVFWAIILSAALLLCVLLFSHPSGSLHSRLTAEKRHAAAGRLWSAWMGLIEAVTDSPPGGGCTSMESAVARVTGLNGKSDEFWRCGTTQCVIYINPDWNKWRSVATNGSSYLNELACFCGCR